MKKTQWIELFHRIKETLVSFIAILFFVCFGIALFIGIGWSKNAIEDSFENEFDLYNLHDYELVSNYKFSDEKIINISNQLDDCGVEETYSAYEYFDINNRKLQAKLIGITNNIDKLFIIDGDINIEENEIIVEKRWALKNNIEIGDYIEFEKNDSFPILKNYRFKVKGTAESPAYISYLAPNYEVSPNGSAINCIMFVSKDLFNESLLPGYNELLVITNQLKDYKTLSADYEEKSLEIKEHINSVVSSVIDDDFTVMTRSDNGSIFVGNIIISLFNKLKYNFASMFIIIGFLICYSTISRLVYLDTKRIGTKQALGFNSKEIYKGYLFYILIVTSLGCIFGMLLGRFVIEPFFLKILANTFIFETKLYYFSLLEFLLICLIEIIIMIIICLLSCRGILKKETIKLLQGYELPNIKSPIFEKTRLWEKIPLLTKCILNNFIYDRRRVIATLIGITGCTSLLVCSLSFGASITGTAKRQYELQKYNVVISYDNKNEKAEDNIEKYLDNNNYLYEKAFQKNISFVQKNDNTMLARLIVGNDEDFNNIVTFNSNNEKKIPKEGAWISIGYAEEYDYKEGDYIKILDSNSKEYDIKIGGVFEYYQQVPYMMMTKETYKNIFNEESNNNIYLVFNDKDSFNTFKDNVSSLDGVISLRDDYASYMSTQSIIVTVSLAIIIIYIILSIVISLCIILDLFIMFIEERKKELIVLMINGYKESDARRYIYTDTLFLSIFGILLGVIVGTLMFYWTIDSVSSDMSYYMHNFNVPVCLVACLISAILILIMCLISLQKINKFELRDINK